MRECNAPSLPPMRTLATLLLLLALPPLTAAEVNYWHSDYF